MSNKAVTAAGKLHAALATANDRIRELEAELSACVTKWDDAASCCAMATNQLAAEREVSDKLVVALDGLAHYAECQVEAFSHGRPYLDMTLFPSLCKLARAALSEVAAIRAKQGGEG